MKSRTVFLVLCVLAVLVTQPISADFVRLPDLLERTGARLEWEPFREIGRLVRGEGTVVFKVGVPFVLLGYERQLSIGEIERRDGTILFPEAAAEEVEDYLMSAETSVAHPRVAVIMIDPGHGGKDPGAIGTHPTKDGTFRIQEKDVVLAVCKRLHQLLSNRYPSKIVSLTRDQDVFLELKERTEKANGIQLEENEAIIFISMHANAAFTKTPGGFEVWYLPPDYKRELIDESDVDQDSLEILPILNTMLEVEYSTESVMLAQEILSGLEEQVGGVTENRGLKAEKWFVVRNSKMPSVLIELGFVTNPAEARLLGQDSYLQRLSYGIYNGVQSFIERFEDTKGFTE